jgi:hypothetical protein
MQRLSTKVSIATGVLALLVLSLVSLVGSVSVSAGALKPTAAAVRLTACENRQANIEATLARVADRGQKQYSLFSSVATKVEAFYTDQDKTLSNYSQLLAAVNTQAAAAQAAVNAVQADSTGFSCTNSPRTFVTTFLTALKSQITAMQAYRTAVRNLVVGVKSVDATTSSKS